LHNHLFFHQWHGNASLTKLSKLPVAAPHRCLPVARYGTPCKDSTAFKSKSSTVIIGVYNFIGHKIADQVKKNLQCKIMKKPKKK